MTLFRKPADEEDGGGTSVPKNHLALVRIQTALILNGEGVK